MTFKESASLFFKKRIFGIIGFVIGFFGPIALFVYAWADSPASGKPSFSIPAFLWPAMLAVLIFYWVKLRGFISSKMNAMKAANELHSGKYAFGITMATVLQWAMTAGTFFFFYWVFKSLEDLAYKTSEAFLALAVIESTAGAFFAVDSSLAYKGEKGKDGKETSGKD